MSALTGTLKGASVSVEAPRKLAGSVVSAVAGTGAADGARVEAELTQLLGRADVGAISSRLTAPRSIAKKVAAEGGALVAGNLSNTNIFKPGDTDANRQVRAMFEEQVGWAAEAGVDYIIAETIPWLGEAEIALDVMKRTKLPTVVTFALHREGQMRDGFTPGEAAKRLADQGADVVGLNCARGPRTMLPM